VNAKKGLISIEGKLSQKQVRTLRSIQVAINAGLPDCDKKSVEMVTWDFICGMLDILENRGHNWICGVDTMYKNPQLRWEQRQKDERH